MIASWDPSLQGSPASLREQESLDDLELTLRREIYQARNIQARLLAGKQPEVPSGKVAATSIAARLIGGDYYDFLQLPNGQLRIIIADVMGKGIPAAMLMILTRGAFRSAAGSANGPGDTLQAMNQALFEDLRALGSFVTVLCADWDPASHVFRYANAGHTPPLLIKPDGMLVALPPAKGVMLGGLPGQVYAESRIQLESGDTVFCYTDGIVEAVNRQGDQFKLSRLTEVLRHNCREDVNGIKQAVVEALSLYTEGMPQKDDITMVLLQITEKHG